MNYNQFVISLQSWSLKPFEWWLRASKKKNNRELKSIWVIGAPRSGTTLTYQLLCTYFKAYYLSNWVAERYRISLTARLIEKNFKSYTLIPNSFKSKIGKTKSESGPHEGGQFFYQFFPKNEPYTGHLDLSDEQKSEFRQLIHVLSEPYELFISKNTFHSLRIKMLSEIFPNSVFIWVRREIASTVYSIIKLRDKLNIKEEEWWGIKPPGWEKAQDLPVIDRTVWQVNQTENIIEKDLEAMGAEFVEVFYKQVCDNPIEVLSKIEEVCGLQKYVRKDENSIPESFTPSGLSEDSLSKKIKQVLK